MPPSRRGSGTFTLPTGQTMATHTRTHDDEDLPHATKKCVSNPDHWITQSQLCQSRNRTMADHLRKYESLWVFMLGRAAIVCLISGFCRFTLTPQRMRMIVEAFKETLELGLQKPKQIVVCIRSQFGLKQFCIGDIACTSAVLDHVLLRGVTGGSHYSLFKLA
jgi:hexokinase